MSVLGHFGVDGQRIEVQSARSVDGRQVLWLRRLDAEHEVTVAIVRDQRLVFSDNIGAADHDGITRDFDRFMSRREP